MIVKKLDLKYENVDNLKSDTLSLCIMGYHDCVPMIKRSLSILSKYVDEIHIQGDNFTESDIKEFQSTDKEFKFTQNLGLTTFQITKIKQ